MQQIIFYKHVLGNRKKHSISVVMVCVCNKFSYPIHTGPSSFQSYYNNINNNTLCSMTPGHLSGELPQIRNYLTNYNYLM